MKSKILIFHPALAPYRVDFFNSVNKKFNAVFYFNLTNVADQKFDQEALRKRCTFRSNYLLNGFEVFGRSFRTGIVLLIKKENPDIVLCSEYGPVTVIVFLYRLVFGKNFKIYTISDDSVYNSQSRSGFRALIRNVISKNIDGIIFSSEEVCNWYKENISELKLTLELPIIHNDLKFRNELVKSRDLANANLKKYNLFGKKVILFVGRLVEVKNLPTLIKVLGKLKSLDWNLIVVGDGVQMDFLKKLAITANISDKIYFIGRQEGLELYSWYTFPQIFVLPSTYERYGAVVNEALLGGCKVLCSELAGASSLINSANGKIFDPYNENEMLNCIETSLAEAESISSYIRVIRENKMPFTYEDKISELLDNLK